MRLSGYSVNGVDFYALIWKLSAGPAWVGRHGLSSDQYQAEFDALTSQGFRPVDISGYELNGEAHYAAVFEQRSDAPWVARHGLGNADYQATVDGLISDGLRPLHVAGYTVGGQDLYATIWEQSAGPEWVTRHGLDADAYQAEFGELTGNGFRPVDISGYQIDGSDAYAAIFELSDGRGWAARHGLNNADYQAAFDENGAAGLRLRSISGFGSGGEARFAAVWEQPGPGGFAGTGGLDGMDAIAQKTMDDAGVPGLSIAIAKDGRLVYAKAFGFADPDAGEATRTDHRFRIASISKPITSVAVMSLVEGGVLDLDDRVFGDGGILGFDYGTEPYSDDMESITVRMLLEHTAGMPTNDGNAPMFRRTDLFGDEFISWVLDNYSLATTPGATHAYSNFGYCLLGRVIEYATARSYEGFVRETTLAACGVTNMEIAGDTLADRRADEVTYRGGAPYDMAVARMDSHGGWLATATDLVRFATRVDGFTSVADILGDGTIVEMTTPSAANVGYAKGWAVNDLNNWWRTGRLDGTESILVRTSGGFCWAALANGNGINLDDMVWAMVESVDEDGWPDGEAQ